MIELVLVLVGTPFLIVVMVLGYTSLQSFRSDDSGSKLFTTILVGGAAVAVLVLGIVTLYLAANGN